MTNKVVNVILEPCATHLHLFYFLVRREINFLFDAINRVVESMLFVEHRSEMIVAAFQAADDFTMLREFAQNGMMQVHMIRRL
jgi:hypothetical protein